MKKKARNSGDNDVDPARSAQMALVRGRDTKPEIRVRKALHAAGLRYRLHDKKLPGSPDLVFPGQSVRASHADMTRSVSTQNGIEPTSGDGVSFLQVTNDCFWPRASFRSSPRKQSFKQLATHLLDCFMDASRTHAAGQKLTLSHNLSSPL